MEGAWTQLSNYIPKNLQLPQRVALELHIRYAQWRYMVSTEDPWKRYCRAIKEYPRRLQEQSRDGALGEQVLAYLRDAEGRSLRGTPGAGARDRQQGGALRSVIRALDTLEVGARRISTRHVGMCGWLN